MDKVRISDPSINFKDKKFCKKYVIYNYFCPKCGYYSEKRNKEIKCEECGKKLKEEEDKVPIEYYVISLIPLKKSIKNIIKDKVEVTDEGKYSLYIKLNKKTKIPIYFIDFIEESSVIYEALESGAFIFYLKENIIRKVKNQYNKEKFLTFNDFLKENIKEELINRDISYSFF